MGYKIENVVALQELTEKSPISGKGSENYCWKLRKRKVKNKKVSKTIVDEPEPSEKSEQAEPEHSRQQKCIYHETDQKLNLKILIPYLDNPPEEAISESSQIKESHKQ